MLSKKIGILMIGIFLISSTILVGCANSSIVSNNSIYSTTPNSIEESSSINTNPSKDLNIPSTSINEGSHYNTSSDENSMSENSTIFQEKKIYTISFDLKGGKSTTGISTIEIDSLNKELECCQKDLDSCRRKKRK